MPSYLVVDLCRGIKLVFDTELIYFRTGRVVLILEYKEKGHSAVGHVRQV